MITFIEEKRLENNMTPVDEKIELRKIINTVTGSIEKRQKRISKLRHFSRIGRQERKYLRQEKSDLKNCLSRYQELLNSKDKHDVTKKYFENLAEQKEAIQNLYKELSEQEVELFQKINKNRPFIPDFNRNDEVSEFAYSLDCQIGKSNIGSNQNKNLKSLFYKVEPYINDKITNPSILHLEKLSQNKPNLKPKKTQEVPKISMKMPSM